MATSLTVLLKKKGILTTWQLHKGSEQKKVLGLTIRKQTSEHFIIIYRWLGGLFLLSVCSSSGQQVMHCAILLLVLVFLRPILSILPWAELPIHPSDTLLTFGPKGSIWRQFVKIWWFGITVSVPGDLEHNSFSCWWSEQHLADKQYKHLIL